MENAGFSPQEFKDMMASVAQTVTVVTAPSDDGPVGITVSAFTSVSVDPPVVLVCIDKVAGSLDAFLSARGYTVSFLPEEAGDDAMVFATKGADKFGTVATRPAATIDAGPVVESAFGHFECSVVDRVEVGDHWVIFGQVNHGGRSGSGPPLVWHDRGFARVVSS